MRRMRRCDLMADAVEMGATLSAVAERFGVSIVAVHKACKRRGVLTSHSRNKLILEALRAGLTGVEVAARFGVTPNAVYVAAWRSRQQNSE